VPKAHTCNTVDESSFCDFPCNIEAGIYDEAVALYARRVAPRVLALYHVGNMRYPGLSDVDLVAVVERKAWDNDQFFSPYRRLPRRYHPVFRHGPQIIPANAMNAVRVASASHVAAAAPDDVPAACGSKRRLVAGTDVLGDRVALLSPEWLRCAVAEAVVTFRRAHDRLHAQRAMSVRALAARAVTLRYPIRHMVRLTGIDAFGDFAREVDDRRAVLVDTHTSQGERGQAARDIHAAFASAVAIFEQHTRALFKIPSEKDVADAARAMLAGCVPMAGVSAAYLAARLRIMGQYIEALRELGFSTGCIFERSPNDWAVTRLQRWPATSFALGVAGSLRQAAASY